MKLKQLAKGSTVELTREVPGLESLQVKLVAKAGMDQVLEEAVTFAAVAADQEGHALSDRHVVFFNQLVTPDGATCLTNPDVVETRLPLVDASVNRFLYVVYLDLPSGVKRGLKQLKELRVELIDGKGGAHLLSTVNLLQDLTTETSLLLGEVYRYKGEWKFRLLADGFTSGMEKMWKSMGV